jgi:hypothetical protein
LGKSLLLNHDSNSDQVRQELNTSSLPGKEEQAKVYGTRDRETILIHQRVLISISVGPKTKYYDQAGNDKGEDQFFYHNKIVMSLNVNFRRIDLSSKHLAKLLVKCRWLASLPSHPDFVLIILLCSCYDLQPELIAFGPTTS